MATNTTNYNLVKPALNETADIEVINSNMDIIDLKLKENNDKSIEVLSSLDEKQNSIDNTLTTTSKTIVGAINELDREVFTLVSNSPVTPNFYKVRKGDSNLSSGLTSVLVDVTGSGYFECMCVYGGSITGNDVKIEIDGKVICSGYNGVVRNLSIKYDSGFSGCYSYGGSVNVVSLNRNIIESGMFIRFNKSLKITLTTSTLATAHYNYSYYLD